MQFYLQKERQVSHSTFKLHLKKKRESLYSASACALVTRNLFRTNYFHIRNNFV